MVGTFEFMIPARSIDHQGTFAAIFSLSADLGDVLFLEAALFRRKSSSIRDSIPGPRNARKRYQCCRCVDRAADLLLFLISKPLHCNTGLSKVAHCLYFLDCMAWILTWTIIDGSGKRLFLD